MQTEIIKTILDTNAVSIWDSGKGPVFWYAANVPGPFYVNTEKIIGEKLSEKMLSEITVIVSSSDSYIEKSKKLKKSILEAFLKDAGWQSIIRHLTDLSKTNFQEYHIVSGGERRDWLFSVPFAYLLKIPHLYLFKKGDFVFEDNDIFTSTYTLKDVTNPKSVHVSDLINNAHSFFDVWMPALKNAGCDCIGNLCVTVRGDNGRLRLEAAGQKVVSLVTVDARFFNQLCSMQLISKKTLDEILLFFDSSDKWVRKYALENPALFLSLPEDAKALERMKVFFETDPLKLASSYPDVFAQVRKSF
ncbi:MAG: hypothetical protein FWF23_05575 [Alphaproteobacteria bacterium]|nr:hypothetical protein [Alphaproteobacteria bacterium]MCL2505866.1 hypothetical protein [Alphaproteobacteria bacterium]